jgi:dynein heavy chain
MDDDGTGALPGASGGASGKEGIIVRGVYLEGAGWDRKLNSLTEARPMELLTPLPHIHFKPSEIKRKSGKGVYTCPVYYYPIRAVVKERASFVIAVDLRTGQFDSDFFVKRGTACILSTQ